LYQSKDALQPVMKFFGEQLPRRGWVLQLQNQGSGRVMLKYV
jgi:hypothetical protein